MSPRAAPGRRVARRRLGRAAERADARRCLEGGPVRLIREIVLGEFLRFMDMWIHVGNYVFLYGDF